jgi:hypothetical protein
MPRSSGAEFVRGYFRFLKRYLIAILLIMTTALLALAVVDYFNPEAHVYSRILRPMPMPRTIPKR